MVLLKKEPDEQFVKTTIREIRWKMNRVFRDIWKEDSYDTDFGYGFKKDDNIYQYQYKEVLQNIDIEKLKEIIAKQDKIYADLNKNSRN